MSQLSRLEDPTLSQDEDDEGAAPGYELRGFAVIGDAAQAQDDCEREASSTLALFEGDEGTLDQDQRKALVVLLKQRFISASSHPQEWAALVRNEQLLRSRLNDLFMDLHLDREREVAFKRAVSPEGGGRFPTLLHDTAWGREDTIVLVYLRTRYRAELAGGAGRCFVDRGDMYSHLEQYRPAHETNLAAEAKRAAKAVENLSKAGLLIGGTSSERFEVSPAIEVLLPLEKLAELLEWLRGQNASSDVLEGAAGDEEFTAEGGEDR